MERGLLRANQNVTGKKRSLRSRAGWFHFQNDKAEGVSIAARNKNGLKGHTQPSMAWTSGKKFPDRIAWNRKSHAARDHRVDSNDSAVRVGKRPTRIARSEANAGLHPTLGAEAADRTDGMDYARGKGADKTERVANGNHKLAGTDPSGIRGGRRGQAGCVDVQRREIAVQIACRDCGFEFAAIPELHADRRTARHVRVGDNETVTGPDHAGTATAVSGVQENG
jgi:hypothetical protein